MLFSFLRRSPDVAFVCSAAIDEIWVRSTALACHAAGMRVAIDICSDGVTPVVSALYREAGIALASDVSFAQAARRRCSVAVTASSGLDRAIYPTRAKTFVHMPHSLASLHMVYPSGAFDGYDVIFAAGPHHEMEYAELAKLRHLSGSVRRIGYGKLDILRQRQLDLAEPSHVFLAPSWGPDNLLDRCGVPLVTALAGQGYRVTVRPHPLVFLEQSPILARLKEAAAKLPSVRIESSIDGDDAIFRAAVMIGDYSGTSLEFAALRRRPVVSVNVGLKIANSDWQLLKAEPVEIAIRSHIGQMVAPDVDAIVEAVKRTSGMMEDSVVEAFLFDGPETCGERAAKCIGEML